MHIEIYDSRVHAIRPFVPIHPDKVSMYVCGPTVQTGPHIGHLRSALVYDLWRGWLTHRGYDVTLIRNVTDIDDKVLALATDAEPWWARAYRVETEFARACAALHISPPTYEPRTSGHIPQIQELIGRLMAGGHAYAAEDGSADVYFDVASWKEYGALTGQDSERLRDSDDGHNAGKRDPRDFALWKSAKPGEAATASWASPWGNGRPGWHVQCSAMSRRYLGTVFDIHGGGLDLRFPHHENELAQSTAAGDQFARYWVHNGLVTVRDQKMAKSLDNSLSVTEVLSGTRPMVLRYYLLNTHYRSALDYHQQALDDAASALGRLDAFRERAIEALGGPAHANTLPKRFARALDHDLNVPAALAVLHGYVRTGNAALDRGDETVAAAVNQSVCAMMRVLGIGGAEWGPATDSTLGAVMDVILSARSRARARRDFEDADRIRDDLEQAGIVVDDAPDGSTWKRR